VTPLPESRQFRSSGGSLAYVDVGEGPAVVLLHGFPTWSYLWRDLVPLLAPRFRVLAVDLLGYGRSARPADAPLHAIAQSRYVRELVAALDVDRFAVIAHGDGASIALRMAVEKAPIDAAVLMSPVAWGGWPAHAMSSIRDRDGVVPDVDTSVRGALASAVVSVELSETDLRTYAAPWTEASGAAAFRRAAAAVDGLDLSHDRDALESLERPMLLLSGEDDHVAAPELLERLNDAMPSSSFGLLPGCGHLLPEEAPDAVFPMTSEYLRVQYLHAPHVHGITDGLTLVELHRPSWMPATEDDEVVDSETPGQQRSGHEGQKAREPAEESEDQKRAALAGLASASDPVQ